MFSAGNGAAFATELGDAVPGHSGTTYADLVGLVIHESAQNGDEAEPTVVPFRHIEGKDAKTGLPDKISVGFDRALPIPGQPARLILFLDLGRLEDSVASVTLLALFSFYPKPTLLDIVEVGNDKETALQEGSLQLLAPGAPLILVSSGHGNSNQTYLFTEAIFVRQDRFALIDSVLSFGDRFCAFDRTQEPRVTTSPGAGPYRDVHVAVRQTVTWTSETGCTEKPPRRGVSTYQATYRWNARTQTYVTSSKELDRLAKENEARF